jgi:hypothetical protein
MNRLTVFLISAACAVLLGGCDAIGKTHNYQYFIDHPDEARAMIGECRLNGTRGMDKQGNAVCDAATTAYQSIQYEQSHAK